MPKIALLGPFTEQMQESFHKVLPDGFEIFLVPQKEDYDKLPEADYIVFRTLELREQTIRTLHRTKLIQRWGVGYDSIDLQAAGAQQIPVAIMSGINSTQVAEMTILLTLAIFRNILPLHNGILGGQWPKTKFMKRSFVIQGKRVGMVGLGSIGMKAAALFKAFGADVGYFDPLRRTREIETGLGIEYLSLETLVARSDIVSLHLPLTLATRHLFNRRLLALMKPTAVLINTSRGGIVDEAALYDALSQGRLLGAGLDVFENEPLPLDSPLRLLNNVVMSPHIGGSSADNNDSMAGRAIDNIVKVSLGQPLDAADLVNAHFLSRGEREPWPPRGS
jgi:phosphoglycerate dehydrogenase-like enzyme